MKHLVTLGLMMALLSPSAFAGKRCTGSPNCTACKNCKYCKHCSNGGSCGVCKPSKKGKHVSYNAESQKIPKEAARDSKNKPSQAGKTQ